MPVSIERLSLGKPYFSQQPQHTEAAFIDLELRRGREASHTVREGVEHIHEYLRHDGSGGLM